MNITVYLGASNGNDQNLILASRELGKWIGEKWTYTCLWRF